ncbi:DeoR/GlpR family DNA-binding transcription regulator [Clostridium ganghwense]|uniref:DeoR/GlpR family DNA-binding transcription regulator n=1 Tax=Clostridium ganghwense TaxID=312089 RepID=A0ABT4CLL7_9CLOT|nr:DeoR/GlpR family DNA-binding transcription regulator [Clostridium ganghwense]MCY6369937.1 DeoR/GlpR family DNA-binding transcription regulator [Clostridium ganghwense]
MLAVDRLKKIEELLIENGSVIISNLSELLDVSEETIRRDFEKLEKENKLKRVRGGAYLPETSDNEVPIRIRENIFLEEKQLLGEKCIELIEDGDCIMLDSSTTALYIAKNLNTIKKKVTVITNSLKIAYEFENSKTVKVICLGGTLRKSTSSFVGYMTTDALQKLSADKAFISCSSISSDFGVTDNHELEATVRKIMLKNSIKKCLVVDYTKFDSPSVNQICKLNDLDMIITDRKIPKEYKDVLIKNEVEIVIVGENKRGN